MFSDIIEKRALVITLITVMAVYLPINYNNCLTVDDVDLLEQVSSSFSNTNYFKLFVPDGDILYYRPMLMMLFHLDYAIWGKTIGAFHFFNYLLHVLNAALLYRVALNVFYDIEKSYLYAVTATLIFALNPLTCESVAWISGRTDIAGAFFSLLAVNCYFVKNPVRYILVPFFVFLGLCCKENALSAIPLIVFLHGWMMYKKGNTGREILMTCFRWSAIVMVPVIIYIFLRTGGDASFENGAARISMAAAEKVTTTKGINGFVGYLVVFPAIAFYLKKLIFPFPLNFSILSVDYTLYSFLFILFVFFNIYWLIQKRLSNVFIGILLVLSFLPAIPIAIGGVSWVPFAERYLYLSLCVWGISLSYLLNRYVIEGRISLKLSKSLIVALIVISAISTIVRQAHWKSNESLFSNSVETDPDNYKALLHYGLSNNNPDRIEYLNSAEALSANAKPAWRARLFLAKADYYSKANRPHTFNDIVARQIKDTADRIDQYNQNKLSESEIVEKVFYNLELVLKNNDSYNSYMKSAYVAYNIEVNDIELKKTIYKKIKNYYIAAYDKRPGPFLLYKIGNLERLLNNNESAAEYFRKVIDIFPESEYANYSKIRLKKIKNQGLTN